MAEREGFTSCYNPLLINEIKNKTARIHPKVHPSRIFWGLSLLCERSVYRLFTVFWEDAVGRHGRHFGPVEGAASDDALTAMPRHLVWEQRVGGSNSSADPHRVSVSQARARSGARERMGGGQ